MTKPWGCFCCCCYCCLGVLTSVWVFTKPQTLYFVCLGAPQVGSITRMQCYLFLHKHTSRPVWRTLSYYDFIYLMVTRQTTTFSPGTWYQAKHRSQPFSSELQEQDKLLVWCESLPVYLVYLCHPTKCGPVTYIYVMGCNGFGPAYGFCLRPEEICHTKTQYCYTFLKFIPLQKTTNKTKYKFVCTNISHR